MKCNTCLKNRGVDKFVVVAFMGKELIMCISCQKTSDMKIIRWYEVKE